MPATAPWRAFISLSTLVSGALAVGFWGLQWNWIAAVYVVLLLYVHEAGHVVAAQMLRLAVRRAPIFIPGLGAFVLLSPAVQPWDEVLVAVGGPVIGAFVALVTKVCALGLHNHNLAFAGDFMLLVNLINMAPFPPLDGGRMLSRTGWVALVPALVTAGLVMVKSPAPVLLIFLIVGIILVMRAPLTPRVPRGTLLGVLGTWAVVAAALFGAYRSSGYVRWPGSHPPAWLPNSTLLLVLFIALVAASQAVLRWAWQPERTAWQRYGLALLAGWPLYLLTAPAGIAASFAACAHLAGLPGLRWLQRWLRRRGAAGDLLVGQLLAHGYDLLWRQGRTPEAEAWLEQETANLRVQPLTLADAYARLGQYGHFARAQTWLPDALGAGPFPDTLDPLVYNNLAWSLLKSERPGEALPHARQAVVRAPDNGSCRDTLGQILLALGDDAAAEAELRQALALGKYTGTRIALARALAGQGRYSEAVAEAERALREHKGAWPPGEPGSDQIQTWLQTWRAAAA